MKFPSSLAGIALSSWLAALAAAQDIRLNDKLARPVGGNVRAQRLSPDGKRLVYLADQTRDERYDLHVVKPSGGSPSIVLVEGNPAGYLFPDFAIGPDSRWVVFRASLAVTTRTDLLAVPLDGGAAPVRLDGHALDVGFVHSFEISPDGRSVVYLSNQERPLSYELFRAPIDGSSPPVKLSDPILPASVFAVSAFHVSPDGRWVVYLDQHGLRQLYGVPIDGSAPARKLSGPLATDGFPQADFAITQGGRVVYRTFLAPAARAELFSAPIDGSSPAVRLNPPFADGRAVDVFRVAPDGRRVVYVADQDTDDVDELFSVPVDGGSPVRLNPALAPGASVTADFGIAPDGSRVVYVADQDTDNVLELFSVPIAGGTPVKLNAPLLAFQDVLPGSPWGSRLRVSPDSRWVLFLAGYVRFELYRAPLDGSGPAVGLGPGDDPEYIFDYEFSPDSLHVVFSAGESHDYEAELYSIPVSAGVPPLELNSEPVPGGGVSVYEPLLLTPDGRSVCYRADQEIPGVEELFVATIDEAQSSVRLSGDLAPGPVKGDVVSVLATSDGSRAVYCADQEADEVFELYSVGTDGARAPVKLDPPLGTEEDVDSASIVLGPDDRWVVFRVRRRVTGFGYRHELYSAPASGLGAPVRLDGPVVVAGGVLSIAGISPDGMRVLYIAEQDADDVHELYSVPIDGSAPAVKLNPKPVPGGGIDSASIGPDSRAVVYLADQETDEVLELFGVPIDGSAQAVKLNPPLPAGGDVLEASIGPDSSSVLFTLRLAATGPGEVRVAPVDGSAPALLLSAPMQPKGFALGARFSPDGSRVVYRADQDTDRVQELFSVPSDGSAPPVKLNRPILAIPGLPGNDVHGVEPWQFTPDGRAVIYAAAQDGSAVELHRVPGDGSAPPVNLTPGRYVAGDAFNGWFVASPDGERLVYEADLLVRQLYSVPADGSGPEVRLSRRGGHVPLSSIRISADGERVVFLADEDEVEGDDVYSASIRGGPPRRVSAPLRRDRDVTRFLLSGERVLYLADRRADQVFELFATLASRGARGAGDPALR